MTKPKKKLKAERKLPKVEKLPQEILRHGKSIATAMLKHPKGETR